MTSTSAATTRNRAPEAVAADPDLLELLDRLAALVPRPQVIRIATNERPENDTRAVPARTRDT